MPVYEYNALDSRGKKINGILDAENEIQLRSRLRSAGNYPVTIKEKKGCTKSSGMQDGRLHLFERIKAEEINVVTRQLATLVGAGIPLVQALSSLIEQTGNSELKRVIAQIREAVNEGATLTHALGEHSKHFSSIFINMVRAGEASGTLVVVLERLADYGDKQLALKGRLQAALVYPVFMAVIGAAILCILITYVVPNITQVFTEMEKTLPLPTLFLIEMSSFLEQFWWVVLIILLLVVYLFKYLINQPRGRSGWDYVKLKMPIVGAVVQKVILARFASTLGSLLGSGVGLMTSMKIVKALTNNVWIKDVLDEAMADIEKGKSMTMSLASSGWFPPMFVQMIAVGEQSGNLEGMLDKVSSAYEREVETAIAGMTSLIEPIMITGMGAAVGLIVLSILLPIFEMNQMVG